MLKKLIVPLVLLSFVGCSELSLENSNKTKEKNNTKLDFNSLKNGHNNTKNVSVTESKKSQSYKVSPSKQIRISKFCNKIEKNFKKRNWGKSQCKNYPWHFVRYSRNNDPLIFTVFEGEAPEKGDYETSLIFCGVHGDEITPVKFCFDVLKYVVEIENGNVFDIHTKAPASLKGKRVVIAPIISPDSFFKAKPTRTNAYGIDINRNFPTKDFTKEALKVWKNRYRKDPRRFPGKISNSEPETIFQVNLIERFTPNKIISVHAPLTMLDYDGPVSQHTGGIVGSRANQLLIRMSEKAKGYRIKNYPFFPGSLGNYAGNERNIPTYTLELPSSDDRKVNHYWKLFKDSIHEAIVHNMQRDVNVASKDSQNDTNITN